MHIQLLADDGFAHEERITLWRATHAEAVGQAETEASTYLDGLEFKYLAQSFHLFKPSDDAKEVFSLIRESEHQGARIVASAQRAWTSDDTTDVLWLEGSQPERGALPGSAWARSC